MGLKRRNKDILIVGAGIAGLTTAYLLIEKGFKVTLVEKEKEVGGLARTFKYNEFFFDIGPHRFYTPMADVLAFIKRILREDYITIPRKSAVWMFNKYYDWPLKSYSLIKFPPHILFKILMDLVFKKKQRGENFEDYILGKYGKTLYKIFFRPYTKKFFSQNPDKIHSDWAKESIVRAIIDKRIRMDNLFQTIKSALTQFSLEIKFIYPESGIGDFCYKLKKRIQEKGGKIITNAEVTDIKLNKDKITSITINKKKIFPSKLIWTAPITRLSEQLGFPKISLNYLSLICYNFCIKHPPKKDYQWCYYGSNDVIFNRISIPSIFNKAMAPEGKSGLCVEVNCMASDKIWKYPESLNNRIINDLIKVGLLENPGSIEAIHIEKIPNTYPIYYLNFKKELTKLKSKLNKITNMFILGRTGQYWYNNMDDSIKASIDLVEKIS